MIAVWFVLLAGFLLHVSHANVVINEIMYHHPANEMFEFVELFNTETSAVSVSGWNLQIGA
jgi:hypothetical protein